MQIDYIGSKRLKNGARQVLAALVCLLFWLANASAQPPPISNTMKKFRAPLEYFPPPHELQIKSFLEGAEAEPQPDGLILIRDAKLQTFQEDGTREMTVITPSCVFDTKQQTVNSAGPLQLQTSDDKLLLEGEGFLWRQTNSDLIISNRVHTTVRGPLTNSFTP
jgi:hypothetical protein